VVTFNSLDGEQVAAAILKESGGKIIEIVKEKSPHA
jgi:hypothetical protein